jgi:predicted kinase
MKLKIPNEGLIVLVGISGSGKSTWSTTNFHLESIVSSDKLREELCLRDYPSLPTPGEYWPVLQQYSREAFDLMFVRLEDLLTQHKIAIADATHLTQRYRKPLEKLAQKHGVPVTYVVFDVPIETCIDRDSMREHPVGEDVIRNQNEKFKSSIKFLMNNKDNSYMLSCSALEVGVEFVPTIHMKSMEDTKIQATPIIEGPHDTVVCDLDGTLANIDHRLKYVKDKRNSNWDLFFKECVNDVPNEWCVELLRGMLERGKKVLIVSARSKVVEKETKEWVMTAIFGKDWTALGSLARYGDKFDVVLVRDEGDYTPDQVLKKRWLDSFGSGNIFFVIDDRDKVCKMWVENGLQVLNCGQGKIF